MGHKTFSDGAGGYRHTPLTRAEADALIAAHDKHTAERAARLPDEQAALRAMGDAYDRLRELGWREAIYCPKDGTIFDVIEAGSTGIHECHYEGDWPKGTWWIHAEGDLWPSRPSLFRLRPPDEAQHMNPTPKDAEG